MYDDGNAIQGSGKSAQRWIAIQDLGQQASREAAKLGVRLMRGPWEQGHEFYDPDADAEMYWLEVSDPHHRHGQELMDYFRAWRSDPPGSKAGHQSFWDYVGGQRWTC